VEAKPLPEPEINVYESDQMIAKYIEFHYGAAQAEPLQIENFQVACIDQVAKHLEGRSTAKALDIGCAAGRSSFELAKRFDQVDGLDFSVRLIEAPSNLQKSGIQRYVCVDEGDLNFYREINLADFEGYEEVKDRISFMQGDACNLVPKFDNYDLVFAGNLIDRLYDPEKFLLLIKDRINAGGLLAIASPYTWSEEYTPRDKWLGGFKAPTGESFTSLEGIAQILEPEFRMIGQPVDLPFVFRETSRKFQCDLSELTIWEKK